MMGYGYTGGAASGACSYFTGSSGSIFGGSSTILFGVIGLLFLALLVVGTILIIAWAAKKPQAVPAGISPREDTAYSHEEAVRALRLQYAKGHINRKEYKEKEKDLL